MKSGLGADHLLAADILAVVLCSVFECKVSVLMEPFACPGLETPHQQPLCLQ